MNRSSVIILNRRNNSYGEKRDKHIVGLYIIVLIISVFAEYNFDIFNLYLYKSYGFYGNALLGFMLLMMVLVFHGCVLNQDDFFLLSYMSITFIYQVIIALLVGGGGYRYAGVVFITFGMTLVLKQINISKFAFKAMLLMSLAALLLYSTNADGYFDRQFVSDLTNSNYIGLLVVFLVIIADICIEKVIKKDKRADRRNALLLRLATLAVATYIILGCKSRAALVSILLYVLCRYLLPGKLFRSKRVVLAMLIGVLIATIALPFVYVSYTKIFDVRFLDRSGMNRIKAWSYTTTHLGDSIVTLFFGHGTRSSLREVLGYPAHNTFLQTWYDTGLIGLLLVDLFTVLCVSRVYTNKAGVSKTQIIAVIGLMALLINDAFGVVFTEALAIWEYSILGIALKG